MGNEIRKRIASNVVRRIPRFGNPKELLKAANELKPYFMSADGTFAWKLFREHVGAHISTKRGYEGSETLVMMNKKGELYLDAIDTKKRGRINPEKDRQEARRGSVQLEAIALNYGQVYDDDGNLLFEGGEQLLKEWRKYKSLAKSKSEKIVDAEKAVSRFNVEFGHLVALKGKDTQTPEGPYDASAIPEYRNPFVVPDEETGELKFNLGNNIKSNDPDHHQDKETLNISGGQFPGTEMEAFTRFILKKSGYSGNISGTNIDTLTTGDYQNAAFLHKPLMRIAAERDRIRQLQKQWNPGIDRFEQKLKTKRSSNLDFKTGLDVSRETEIVDYQPGASFSYHKTGRVVTAAEESILLDKSAAFRRKNMPAPNRQDIKRMKNLGYYWDEKEWEFRMPERDINPQQTGIDLANRAAVVGFDWAANRYTAGTYGQIKNMWNLGKNIRDRNVVGAALNVAAIEVPGPVKPNFPVETKLTHKVPQLSPGDTQMANTLAAEANKNLSETVRRGL